MYTSLYFKFDQICGCSTCSDLSISDLFFWILLAAEVLRDSVELTVKGEELLSGQLVRAVDPEESSWIIDTEVRSGLGSSMETITIRYNHGTNWMFLKLEWSLS